MVRFASACMVISAALLVAAQGPKTTWDKVYTAEQAVRGEKLYADNCASCHGESLGGVEMAPPLAGDTFNSNWEGVSLNDLFERMRTSMPQNKPGSLSRAQNADILAHILKVGGFPAGDAPLDGQAGALMPIKFVTYKP
ncbi:MAG TPA: c-type cytochrome [Vicinamibacterales bacterium]|nr:c-type cytochrome [Vicinamibacterales bacterium]